MTSIDLSGSVSTAPLEMTPQTRRWLNDLPEFEAVISVEANTVYEMIGTITWHSFRVRPSKTQRLRRMHRMYARRR